MSVTCRVAEKPPVLFGENVTLIVQFAPAAKLAPQLLVWEKRFGFAPPSEMLLIVSGAVPELVNVMVCAALVVPRLAVKLSEVGARTAVG